HPPQPARASHENSTTHSLWEYGLPCEPPLTCAQITGTLKVEVRHTELTRWSDSAHALLAFHTPRSRRLQRCLGRFAARQRPAMKAEHREEDDDEGDAVDCNSGDHARRRDGA